MTLGADRGRELWAAELATHEAELRTASRYICRNDSEREDLIQDTFERALRHLGRRRGVEGRGSVGGPRRRRLATAAARAASERGTREREPTLPHPGLGVAQRPQDRDDRGGEPAAEFRTRPIARERRT